MADMLNIYNVIGELEDQVKRCLSLYRVERYTRIIFWEKRKRKMGLRSSPTAEMILEDAIIPAENLIGQEGQGFTVAMRALDSGRITIAASALGIAQAFLWTNRLVCLCS